MKLSQFFTATTPLDDFTVRHLRQWFERGQSPVVDDPETTQARMLAFLESQDADTREFYLSRGWTAVFDAMEAAK